MATTITGKLNKAATTFQAGDSTGFGLRIGVQYYDRETKQKEWTNFEAVIFAKPGPQADFYAGALVEGSIVEVSGQSLKIKKFEGQNGLSLSIELVDAKIGYIGTVGAGQQSAPQQGYGQAPQQGYAQQNKPAPHQQPAPKPQAPQGNYQPQQNAAPAQRPAPQPAQNFTPDLDEGWDDDIPF